MTTPKIFALSSFGRPRTDAVTPENYIAMTICTRGKTASYFYLGFLDGTISLLLRRVLAFISITIP